MSTSRTALRIVVPLAVLGVGIAVMVGFLRSKRAPKPQDHARPAPLVVVNQTLMRPMLPPRHRVPWLPGGATTKSVSRLTRA